MKFSGKNRLPEGAISLEIIDEIHLHRFLEERGEEGLIPVVNSFAEGQILEEGEELLEAQALYKAALGRHPGNKWLKKALQRVKYSLN